MWKNFENRLAFGKLKGKRYSDTFFRTRCTALLLRQKTHTKHIHQRKVDSFLQLSNCLQQMFEVYLLRANTPADAVFARWDGSVESTVLCCRPLPTLTSRYLSSSTVLTRFSCIFYYTTTPTAGPHSSDFQPVNALPFNCEDSCTASSRALSFIDWPRNALFGY